MIKFECFTRSNSQQLTGKRSLVIVFGAGSSGVDSDGWDGGVAVSFYENIGAFYETDVQIGCGGDAGIDNAGMTRFLNTIATGGGIIKHGTEIIAPDGTKLIIDNGVGAMGNWLSIPEFDRSTLRASIKEYVDTVWRELTATDEWNTLFNILESQKLMQITPTPIFEYDIDGETQPGARGTSGNVGACGAVFVFTEYEDA